MDGPALKGGKLYSCIKQKPFRSQKYLDWIRTQPVLVQGQGETVYHHVRIDGNAGTGTKPSDTFSVPLPKLVHDAFHAGQESDRQFWERHNINIYRELHRLVSNFIKAV